MIREEVTHLIDGPPFAEPTETGQTLPLADATLLARATPSKVMCLGRNYDAHAAEMGYTPIDEPGRPAGHGCPATPTRWPPPR